MEVAVPAAIVHDIFGQLRHQNAAHRGAFADVVADYMGALQRSRELQVINVRFAMLIGKLQSQNDGQPLPNAKPFSLFSVLAQVRCAQLDKEAAELRAENETLLRSAEAAKHSAAVSAQVSGTRPPCRRKFACSMIPSLTATTCALLICRMLHLRHGHSSCRTS